MAMTYTAIADKPVLVEEGTFAMNYEASGTIYAGCALCCSGGTELVKPMEKDGGAAGAGFIGIAAYNATDGDQLSVYGPGNKVRVRASGAITVGQSIKPVPKGFFQPQTVVVSGSFGVALENISDGSYGKVLIY